MLPEPFYRDERADITIYCGDSLAILPHIDRAALVCTDPPYGIGGWTHTGGNSISASEADDVRSWDRSAPSPDLLRLAVGAAPVAVVWGGNYFAGILGPWRSPLVWDKSIRGMHFADGELAWTNFDHGSLRIFNCPTATRSGEAREHPTQKPTALIRWCIELSRTEGVVLDPFMGSGTTLRAAKDLGRPAIGIELSEAYCAVAVRRLGQEVFDWAGAR